MNSFVYTTRKRLRNTAFCAAATTWRRRETSCWQTQSRERCHLNCTTSPLQHTATQSHSPPTHQYSAALRWVSLSTQLHHTAINLTLQLRAGGEMVRELDLQVKRSRIRIPTTTPSCNDLGQVVHTHLPPFTEQYNSVPVKRRRHHVAGKVTVGLVSHRPCTTDFSS